jgi:pimeloyl-ACP methyl ester carboxylesterase
MRAKLIATPDSLGIADLQLKEIEHSEQFDALLKQSAAALTKQDLRTMFESMEAVINRVTFSPDYYRKKPDEILIIDSEDDDVLPKAALDLVPKLCPGARHHRFHKGGHLTMISNRDEYRKLIVDFLS